MELLAGRTVPSSRRIRAASYPSQTPWTWRASAGRLAAAHAKGSAPRYQAGNLFVTTVAISRCSTSVSADHRAWQRRPPTVDGTLLGHRRFLHRSSARAVGERTSAVRVGRGSHVVHRADGSAGSLGRDDQRAARSRDDRRRAIARIDRLEPPPGNLALVDRAPAYDQRDRWPARAPCRCRSRWQRARDRRGQVPSSGVSPTRTPREIRTFDPVRG